MLLTVKEDDIIMNTLITHYNGTHLIGLNIDEYDDESDYNIRKFVTIHNGTKLQATYLSLGSQNASGWTPSTFRTIKMIHNDDTVYSKRKRGFIINQATNKTSSYFGSGCYDRKENYYGTTHCYYSGTTAYHFSDPLTLDGNFTLEGFVGVDPIFRSWGGMYLLDWGKKWEDGSTYRIGFEYAPNVSQVRFYNHTTTTTNQQSLASGQLHHIALTYDRSAKTLKTYVNGTLTYTKTSFTAPTTFQLSVDNYTLHINKASVSNIIRYTANFTPNTSMNLTKDSNTVWMIGYNSTGALKGFYHSVLGACNAELWQCNDTNVQQGGFIYCTNTGGKTTGYCLYAPTTNNNIMLKNIALQSGNNFTVSCWVNIAEYFSTYSDGNCRVLLLSQANRSSDKYSFLVFMNSSGKLGISYTKNNWSSTASSKTSSVSCKNTWAHIAVAYNNTDSTVKFYINGTLANTFSSVSIPVSHDWAINIFGEGTSCAYTGYNDLFMVHFKEAWTTDFTPPTALSQSPNIYLKDV